MSSNASSDTASSTSSQFTLIHNSFKTIQTKSFQYKSLVAIRLHSLEMFQFSRFIVYGFTFNVYPTGSLHWQQASQCTDHVSHLVHIQYSCTLTCWLTYSPIIVANAMLLQSYRKSIICVLTKLTAHGPRSRNRPSNSRALCLWTWLSNTWTQTTTPTWLTVF